MILFFPVNYLFSQNLEISGKEEIDIYMELLKTSGETLFMPSSEDVEILIQNYLNELYESQKQLTTFYKILKTLGYINENNILEMEFRNYKEHFFEKKELEIFSEHLRIEWEQDKPKWIIFRSKSSVEPKLNIRNTIFVLPAIQLEEDLHKSKRKFLEPEIQVFGILTYSSGLGEKYNFYLPGKDRSKITLKDRVQIFDFVIKDVPPRSIDDPRLKILTFQYLIYRLRYLDIKIRNIVKNKLRKNMTDFYKSLPDSRY